MENSGFEESGIPTEAQWRSEPWGLDEPYAYEAFFGKSLTEAEGLFESNALSRQEDLMCMPFPVFKFYVVAFINYMLGDCCRGGADGVNGFLSMAELRMNDLHKIEESTTAAVARVLERIRTGQEWFDADYDIDGDISARVERILGMLHPR